MLSNLIALEHENVELWSRRSVW